MLCSSPSLLCGYHVIWIDRPVPHHGQQWHTHVLVLRGTRQYCYRMFYCFVLFNGWRRNKAKTPLPPGPPAWPIVGNLFQLGRKPNESTSFSGRTVIEAAKILSHHKSSLIWAEHGPRWRKLRRIATTELFSHDKLQGLQHLRRDQTFRMIQLIFEAKGNVVDIGYTAFCASLNLLGNMIFSTDVFDPYNPASTEFKDTVCRLMKLGGTANLVDFFPFLGFLDPQGVSRQTTKYTRRLYDFVDTFIEKRLASRSESPEKSGAKKDFLDVLLDFSSEDFILEDVRALIAELFIASTETTTTTIEWAVAELFHNPQKVERVRGELDGVVGCKRRVEESDLEHLPYLRAVVKEIFRLHPRLFLYFFLIKLRDHVKSEDF